MEVLEKINDLNKMIQQGKTLEAFEKYYHEVVVMQENENPPTTGKSSNRKREEEFNSRVVEFRKAEPLKIMVGDNLSAVEWHFDYTHKDWGVRNYKQVFVQEWKDGKIIKEVFYYGS
jgi:hypothetical protein